MALHMLTFPVWSIMLESLFSPCLEDFICSLKLFVCHIKGMQKNEERYIIFKTNKIFPLPVKATFIAYGCIQDLGI